MASYHHLLQHKDPRLESPAKVFGKLKSRVQRESAECPRDTEPRRRREERENHRFGSDRSRDQALNLSPILTESKQHRFVHSGHTEEEEEEEEEDEHVFVSRNTPRQGAFLESTTMGQLHRENNRADQRNRAPLKSLPEGNGCVRTVFEQKLVSPPTNFSPMKQRLRKRTREQQDVSKLCGHPADEVNDGDTGPPRGRTIPSGPKQAMGHPNDIADVSAFQPEVIRVVHEPLMPPSRPPMEKCLGSRVIVDKLPAMSPAKMFALMKERENKKKRDRAEVREVHGSAKNLFSGGNDFHQTREHPPTSPHDKTEMEDTARRNGPDDTTEDLAVSAPSQCSGGVLIPTAPPLRVLLEDPLVLNSPQISLPKRELTLVKHNKWAQHAQFPNDSVIYLKNWIVRKCSKGLFVDGVHREDNIPWNSNVIVDRVSNTVLKTVTGRVYILDGKMNSGSCLGFPKWFLKKFMNGFPPDWKSLYEKFLSESSAERSKRVERTEKGDVTAASVKSEAPPKLSGKQHKEKLSKTSESCPPASSSFANRVSRSGRVIKAPLEYWKGGRVILDADMNVTIHECYDTSICPTPASTAASARKPRKPDRVFLPSREGHKQNESVSDEVLSKPSRKVNAPVRGARPKQPKVGRVENPPHQATMPGEANGSPEECSRRTTWSRKRSLSMEKTVDVVPEKRRDSREASTRQARKKNTPAVPRTRKGAVSSSPESPAFNGDSVQQQPSDDEFTSNRWTQKRGGGRKRGGRSRKRPPSIRESPQSQLREPSEESRNVGKRERTRTAKTKDSDAASKVAKHQQSNGSKPKTSPPAKPVPKSAHSSKTKKAAKEAKVVLPEPDEDEWTKAELMKLHEAVLYYPQHVSSYWAKVAKMVGTRSAEECHNQLKSLGKIQSPAEKPKKHRKGNVEAPTEPVSDQPLISAKRGTLRRKQQVRKFLETMPKDDAGDVFTSAYMQKKRFMIPSVPSGEDHMFTVKDLEPLTPSSKVFPEVKTPQCLHITPSMMGCADRDDDDKYVYHLQKRTRKNQFNAHKPSSSSKRFTPTPSVKRTMRRCENTEKDTFVVWEMFPGNDEAMADSEEEEDFYFSEVE